MLNQRLETELNKQFNAEMYSAYLYLSMSAYLESENLSGFANWMKIQYEEEQSHALKIYQYVLDRGGKMELEAIAKPETKWANVIQLFEEVLKHEESVTASINNIINIAYEEKDHASVAELQWFVTEQIEEEANVNDILVQLKMIEGKGAGLFMLDREMKQRVFVEPK